MQNPAKIFQNTPKLQHQRHSSFGNGEVNKKKQLIINSSALMHQSGLP